MSSPSAAAKGFSHLSSVLRRASVSTKPAGTAPLAARSLRFTRSALRATVSGGSSGRKCTPSTMASVVTTMSLPSGCNAAASSSRRKAPGWVASGRKYRAISESSPDAGFSLATRELVGAELARDLVEHGVDHAGLVLFDEGMRDVDIFGHDHTARHVLAVLQFVGARAQHRAQNRVDPLKRPSLLERIVDQGIELGLIADHAGHHVLEERC